MKFSKATMVLVSLALVPAAQAAEIEDSTCKVAIPVMVATANQEAYSEMIKAAETVLTERGYQPYQTEIDHATHKGQLILHYDFSLGVKQCEAELALVRVTSVNPREVETLYERGGKAHKLPFCSLEPEKAVKDAIKKVPGCRIN